MTLESFEYLINQLKSASDLNNSFYKMGLDLQVVSDAYYKVIEHLLKTYYGEKGEDWIGWFLYERTDGGDKDQAWDENKNPICYDVKSLWEHVEKIRTSEDFVEYVPKEEISYEERIKQIQDLFSNFKNDGIE